MYYIIKNLHDLRDTCFAQELGRNSKILCCFSDFTTF